MLIVAGDGAIEALASDLDDAEITVEQDVPADCGDFESRTVALINRGVPGFAVERDGTLHSSLMRSCTGWPSGTWIDPPARKAPTARTSNCSTGATPSTSVRDRLR